MGDDLVSGAAVGSVFAEVFRIVKQEVQTARMFRPRFKSIESTLKYLEGPIAGMKSANDQLDISNEEELSQIHDLLKECQVLARKCSRVGKWNFWRKKCYSEKLLALDNAILKFCQLNLQIVTSKDVKASRVDMALLNHSFVRLSVMQEKEIKEDHPDRSTIQFHSCTSVPQCPDFLVGMDEEIKNIKEKLLNGSEPVIVISAAGGYGKTTLVKKLYRDEQVTGKYKDIIFVVVSESPSLMAIVQQITHHLGGTVPDAKTHTEDYTIQHLKQMLAERGEQNPILLILDDIWSGSESILEKFVFIDIPNYKVLVTSRFQFPAIGSTHLLKGLEHEDAVKLLCRAATPLVRPSTYTLPNIEIIDQVARRCKGSPLALTVVGKSLCGREESAWKRKLNDWSNGMSLIGGDESNSEILKCLMNSLKDLDGGSEESARLKQFFLDLGSFPEDHMISVAILIDMWSELHGVDWNEVDFVADIKELSARSLADLIIRREDIGEGDGYYNDMYLMQHDMLRELAIYQNRQGPIEERQRLNLEIRKNNVPKMLQDQKQPFRARLVSICTDEEFCSSSWPDLDFPEAEVLVVNFRTTKNNYTLPHFISKMVNLKTLIVTNNGPLPVELTNFHRITCLPSLKKIRLEHIKIPSFNTMNNLEKISAFHCDISEEIQTTDLQISEVFPKLEEIDISYCHNLKALPNGICDAKNLKKISITHCHKLSELPEEIGNLLELQVLRLNTCTDLETLPSSIVELENLSFIDISNCISIFKLPDRIGELHQLKELHLSWCSSLCSLPSSVRRLEQLEYLIVDKEQVVNFRRYFKNIPKLKLKVAAQDRSLNFLGRSWT